jgi:hypothetical protein
MMMDEKLVNRRMIMDKKILAGDEDGWISCSMVKYYFPSIIKLDFVSKSLH